MELVVTAACPPSRAPAARARTLVGDASSRRQQHQCESDRSMASYAKKRPIVFDQTRPVVGQIMERVSSIHLGPPCSRIQERQYAMFETWHQTIAITPKTPDTKRQSKEKSTNLVHV